MGIDCSAIIKPDGPQKIEEEINDKHYGKRSLQYDLEDDNNEKGLIDINQNKKPDYKICYNEFREVTPCHVKSDEDYTDTLIGLENKLRKF